MTRTHDKVGALPRGAHGVTTPEEGAARTQEALKFLQGAWKIEIAFQLFHGRVLRFSELERAIPGVSQKMLAQQLRQMESDGLVRRVIYAEVPTRVDYALTEWGEALCPVLDALLTWAAQQRTSAS